jgi:riboflavin kinase / FMN adenylyltransferase
VSTGSVVTVGTFDGVHRGHQHVLRELMRVAEDRGLRPVVVSFEPHPLEILRPDKAPLLLAPGIERLETLTELGVTRLAILPFTRQLASLTAEQFVDFILRPGYDVRHLLVGYDHGFGRGREGDAETLRRICASRSIELSTVGPVASTGGPVSSSAIREALIDGDLESAAEGLGRRYSIRGTVTRGRARGRAIGIPTINVRPVSPRKLLPRIGVYAVMVDTPSGRLGGMMNLGPRPTFGDHEVVPEVHLFDTSGDFYSSPVRIELIERLRETRRFESADMLVAQLGVDEKSARRALTQVL